MMKKYILSILLILPSMCVWSTVQSRDLLVLGKDTINLDYYDFTPFDEMRTALIHEDNMDFTSRINTACWRGYKAVWQIVNDSLFLEKLYSCDRKLLYEKNKLMELFKFTDFKYKEENGMIFADWCSIDLYKSKMYGFNKKERTLSDAWDRRKKKQKEIYLQVINGVITINKLNQ